jgi:site-specific DNA-methyltransferase (adenine-specific)
MRITEKLNLYNTDCMDFMRDVPDNYYELAIVDPPYGINMGMGHKGSEKRGDKNKYKTFAGCDNSIPTKEYFDELFRVSKNQIIWGANYMTKFLEPKASWIIWDKKQPEDFSMAMAELAWSSFGSPMKIYQKRVVGADDVRVHPTQKPVALYKWLLDKYAKPNDKILDTHGGSMSIAIACHDYGFDLDLCELDKEYFDKGVQRVKNHVAQTKLF